MLKRQLTYPADAARFYQAIRHMSWAMWLDSGVLSERAAGYDILVADPVYRVICHGEITETVGPEGKVHQSTDELMSILRQLLGEAADADHPLLFTGGAVGYFS
jgi:para-aminobenzoate synthetase component 1